MYINRHAEESARKLAEMFGAVLVIGPRQVGKTTMLKRVASEAEYVTLDDPLLLATAIEQSGTFFKDNPPPVFIDEIQYAPKLFTQIKIIIDREKKKGQFFMSGLFQLMENISESLAGRLGLLTLLGLSMREKQGIEFSEPFLPTDEYFTARKKNARELSYDEVWAFLLCLIKFQISNAVPVVWFVCMII